MRRLVSAVLISYNEESRVADCLASLDWTDEIVVVDSGSSDATQEIARRYADKVVELPWRGFGPQKQAAVDLASHDMVFVVDCDEQVTPELAAEIAAILQQQEIAAGYAIPRRTFIGKKEIKHCGWYPDRTVRLFDRKKAHFSDSLVHESVIVTGEVAACRHDLLHFSYRAIGDMVPKISQYSELWARQMFTAGKRSSFLALLVKPLAAFFKTYVLKKGFLDGFEGLVIAKTTAFLTFLKYAKLIELTKTSNHMP